MADSYAYTNEAPWLKGLRAGFAASAAALDWPSKKNEEWRRSPVSLFDLTLSPGGPAGVSVTLPEGGLPAGVTARVADGALPPEPAAWAEAALKAVPADATKWFHWQRSGLSPVVVVDVPAGRVVEGAVTIRFDYAARGVFAPTVLIRLGEGAAAEVTVRHHSAAGTEALVLSGAVAEVGAGAQLQWSELQDLDPSSRQVDHGLLTLGRDAVAKHLHAAVGGGVVKTHLEANLSGPGADLHTHGMYFTKNREHKELYVVQNHNSPQANSRALYKGALRDSSRAVFQGLIEVKPGAAKTDAYLSNKNLLLNDGSKAESLPQLRIDNNDVKCSHGSTTGKVSEDELFYLCARGLSRSEATRLITEGLFADLVDAAPADLRDELWELVGRSISG